MRVPELLLIGLSAIAIYVAAGRSSRAHIARAIRILAVVLAVSVVFALLWGLAGWELAG